MDDGEQLQQRGVAETAFEQQMAAMVAAMALLGNERTLVDYINRTWKAQVSDSMASSILQIHDVINQKIRRCCSERDHTKELNQLRQLILAEMQCSFDLTLHRWTDPMILWHVHRGVYFFWVLELWCS